MLVTRHALILGLSLVVLALSMPATAANCPGGFNAMVAALKYPCDLLGKDGSCREIGLQGLYPSRSAVPVPADAEPQDAYAWGVCVALEGERKLALRFDKGFNIGMPPRAIKVVLGGPIVLTRSESKRSLGVEREIVVLKGAYDLNPNDLSVKCDVHPRM